METIDYASRAELVTAVVDFRKRGVLAEVVGDGRTLRFPNGIDSTPEDETPEEEESLLGVVQPPPAEEPPAEEEKPAEEEGATVVHTTETPADEEEDLIGAPAKATPPAHPTKSQKRNRGNRQS